MKVLVTGATGFVGRHVVATLLRRGHEVLAVSRDAARARECDWFGDVEHVASDLHAAPDDALRRFAQVDAAVHLAWPGLPNYRALFHVERNLPVDIRLLGGLVRAGVRRLLVTGTCFEYGMRNGVLAENMDTDPGNAYGLAKDALRRYPMQLQRELPFSTQWTAGFGAPTRRAPHCTAWGVDPSQPGRLSVSRPRAARILGRREAAAYGARGTGGSMLRPSVAKARVPDAGHRQGTSLH